jgi:hypothetical protein
MERRGSNALKPGRELVWGIGVRRSNEALAREAAIFEDDVLIGG